MNPTSPRPRSGLLRQLVWLWYLLSFSCAVTAAPELTVRIMGINDFHGFLERGEQRLYLPDQTGVPKVAVDTGGAANLQRTLQALREAHPHNLFISSGDMVGASPLESGLFHDEPTIEFFNQIGLDVAVFGNHEFDHGWAEIQRLMRGGCAEATGDRVSCLHHPFQGSTFAWVGSNVRHNGRWFAQEYAIIERSGLRIGVIGVELPSTVQMVPPKGIQGMEFEDELATVQRVARQLDQLGVHAKILSIHDGGNMKWLPVERSCESLSQPFQQFSRDAARYVDAIFSGHTHQGYACDIEGVPVVQAFSYGRAVAVVDLTFDAARKLLKDKTRYALQPVWAQDVPADVDLRAVPVQRYEAAATPAMLEPYLEQALLKTQQKVGRLSEALANRPMAGEVESTGARLVADAQLAFAQTHDASVDLALMNLGGVRISLGCSPAPCDITYGQLSSLQPFRNGVVMLDMTGHQLLELLEAQSRNFPYSVLTPSHTLTYTWQIEAAGTKHVHDVKIKGETLEPDRHYKVVVNSFLADGGDGHRRLLNLPRLAELGEDLHAIEAWFRKQALVQVPLQARIRIKP